MENITEYIRQELKNIQDLKYRDFNAKLIPTVDIEKIVYNKSIQKVLESLRIVLWEEINVK